MAQLVDPPHSLRPSRWVDVTLWLLRRRRRFRVTGDSMQPLLRPGEEVLMHPRAYAIAQPQPGDIVVAQHPHRPDLRVIKWVVVVDPHGCFLQGVNLAASTDSRSFGLVPFDAILGQVVCRFP